MCRPATRSATESWPRPKDAWRVGMLLCRVARSLPRCGAGPQLSRRSSSLALPGVPRRLAEVAKLELLEAEEPASVSAIWESFHKDRPEVGGSCVSAEEHGLISERARDSPSFIFPVRREQGHFILYSQFDAKHSMFVMTFLEEYKTNPAAAQPWLSVTLFGELLASKALGLLRVEAVPERLVKAEAVHVLSLVRRYYGTDNYDRVWTFNHAERHFDLEAYLRSCP